ncbi:hypothetical protein F511_29650 [Dorcoceras hygrometricum]|uniref:Uncharacterized protein n=1 Tax=Dorcoceras hygrometricum TaxID=472368 RepID=A0A2Z7C791_9LAMI|nr:hypothetical protein F511_29650 [Dorcoceras hygrometricum]
MRSVVASHGPGSNPRGNAICNAILLQCFPVLQIFELQYLDHHRPPSSDVLPLTLLISYLAHLFSSAESSSAESSSAEHCSFLLNDDVTAYVIYTLALQLISS